VSNLHDLCHIVGIQLLSAAEEEKLLFKTTSPQIMHHSFG
jgi:hypothetical protein